MDMDLAGACVCQETIVLLLLVQKNLDWTIILDMTTDNFNQRTRTVFGGMVYSQE
jgi:hypothetical protein